MSLKLRRTCNSISIVTTTVLLVLFTTSKYLVNGQHDFQFENENNDDLQVIFSEPIDVVSKAQHSTNLHKKEKSRCSSIENKIILTLVLRDHSWDEIVELKQQRAIKKLANFFTIPKESLVYDDITRTEIKEMTKQALHHGQNSLENIPKKLGRVEFLIGCGKSLFPSGKLIANQIDQQMKDGVINEITGLDYGWWSIWTKYVNNRVPRVRRQASEGSGEDDYIENDDYDEEYEDEESITETPSHPHRHHHGDSKNDIDDVPAVTEEDKPSTLVREIPLITTPQPLSTTDKLTTTPSTITTILTTTSATTTTEEVVTLPPSTTAKLTELTTVEEKESSSSESIVPVAVSTTTEKSVESTTEQQILTTQPIIRRQSAATSATTKHDDDDNYDDEYDDDDSEQPTELPTSGRSSSTVTEKSTTPDIVNESATTTVRTTTTLLTTTPATTTTLTTTTTTTTTEAFDIEPVNTPPMIKNRLPKQPVTAGKPFSLIVDAETFYDNEDGTDLQLELFDKNEHALKPTSWIQFNPDTREIYGLPLEDAVSRWQYKLRATDSAGESTTETFDVTVQQHKGHRSVNHEITIGVKITKKFENSVDWQIRLIRGIVETAGDSSMSNVVVREIRTSIQDPNAATFVYTNETLPKDKCPEEKLDELVEKINARDLSSTLYPEMTVKVVSGQQIGPCLKQAAAKPTKPTQGITKNFAPVPRNQVDRVEAIVNQLLVFKVPSDTFYDPEDQNDLSLSLKTSDSQDLDPQHWLQFDAKNQEFYGIPKQGDLGRKDYLLIAKDREGLSATDALIVVVNPPMHKRDYNVLFEMTLGIAYEQFNNSLSQRRFVERIGQIFADPITSHIQMRTIRHIHHDGNTLITFYNTTLHRLHQKCPNDEIEVLRNILLHHDGSIKERVREVLGNEFNLLKVGMVPVGTCQGAEAPNQEVIPITKDETPGTGSFKDDYLLTFVLPAAIIVLMLLLAFIIACALHRRRMTGKMELGDEEERCSFRSKGIPVIFQDELDEKPEIGNKSPVILKDEKPPLLPPSYTSTNPDDDDLEEYIPPPGLNNVNGRESRGKSPVTPSYRKPPPYVSP